VNRQIHTNAIKENLIPDAFIKQYISTIYATRADLLNIALFGVTAQQWRNDNPRLLAICATCANRRQPVCLVNM
jgi:hypothetical protein